MIRVALLLCLFASPILAADPDPLEQACLTAAIGLGAKAQIDETLEAPCRVTVEFTTLTDATLAKLAKLPCIGSLKIENAGRITAGGLGTLTDLPNLQVLTLGASGASNAEVQAIGSLKTIQVLYLGQSTVTDSGLAGLKPLKWLKSLDLYDTRTSDQGLKQLTGFAELEELNLSGTRVTDKGLATLAEIKSLKQVRLNRTDVHQEAVRKLEEAIPKIVVRY